MLNYYYFLNKKLSFKDKRCDEPLFSKIGSVISKIPCAQVFFPPVKNRIKTFHLQ